MDSKKVGYIILVLSLLLGIISSVLVYTVISNIREKIVYDEAGNCVHPSNQVCPYQQINGILVPVFFGGGVLLMLAALGIYLIFFEKSEKEVISTLKEIKQKETSDEKFSILLSALDEAEQKVVKAVKEQDGISQSTLRLRTDLSKTKLSIVLKSLEGKSIIKKIQRGKINLIYLKKQI